MVTETQKSLTIERLEAFRRMDMDAICFDRNLKQMQNAAAAGCHCCAIFVANAELLDLPIYKRTRELKSNGIARILIVANEALFALGGLSGFQINTPLRFVLKPAQPLPPEVTHVEHEPFTGSPSSFAQAREWLRNCRETHSACHSQDQDYRPTRLLHIDWQSRTLRLKQKSSYPANIKYATLSHCWGQAVERCLENDNLHEFERGIPFNQLARTFRDAVTVCQELEFEYIWIDRFCIIQDSIEDWKVEALQMQYIYGNSALNVAATDSKDCHGGLFRERDVKVLRPFNLSHADLFFLGKELSVNPFIESGQYPDIVEEGASENKDPSPKEEDREDENQEEAEQLLETLQENESGAAGMSIFDISLCWDRFEQAPLNRRSWVFQERFLSPRVLHFDKDQLLWECHSLTACERFPGPQGIDDLIPENKRMRASLQKLERMKKADRTMGREFYDIWRPLIKSYTAAGLTKLTDRLIAIEGIGQWLGKTFDCSYVAGLFTRNMESQLAWKMGNAQWEEVGARMQQPRTKIAPSWSWASYLGEVDMLSHWESVDGDGSARHLKDEELKEIVLCEVTNKEQLAASWNASAEFKELPLGVQCFMAKVRLIDFSEVKSWPKGKQQLSVWCEEQKKAVYSDESLPFDKERPLDDLWPLLDLGGHVDNRQFRLWDGSPGREVIVHSLTGTQEDSFKVTLGFDSWRDFRKRRSIHLLPTHEVTNYKPQDIWEQSNYRMIQGLVLDRLEEEGNRFQRIGMFRLGSFDREKFWRATIETDVPDLTKHLTKVSTWPDINWKVGSGKPFKYDEKVNMPQYQIVIV